MALLPSNEEAQLVGDIAYYLGKALAIVRRLSATERQSDDEAYFAARYAVQCAIEACVKLEGGKKTKGRFPSLFPDFDLRLIKRVADSGRHDYARSTSEAFWITLETLLSDLHSASINLRDAKIDSQR